MKCCEKLSKIESNWVELNNNELMFTQFDSSLLNFVQVFAKFHSILLEKTISSKNDEQPVIWKCSKPLAWLMYGKFVHALAQDKRSRVAGVGSSQTPGVGHAERLQNPAKFCKIPQNPAKFRKIPQSFRKIPQNSAKFP